MDKATLVKSALKGRKSSKGTAKVAVVNVPTVKIDNGADRKMPPTLHLSSDDLPAIKNWQVDKTYKLTLEVTMTGIRRGSYYEMVDAPAGKKTQADFEITSVRSGS